jgi:PAS domain S-box-containing protein
MKKSDSGKSDRKRMSRDELAERMSALQVGSAQKSAGSSRERELNDVLHELEVSQIELEVQNQELIESRQALAESHDRYLSLYDFAPIAYLTLDKLGVVREANLAASELLGFERQRLLNNSLAPMIAKTDVQRFREHLILCRSGETTVSAVINLLGLEKTVIPVKLSSTCARDIVTGELLFRTTMTDLTEQKRADAERQALLDRAENSRQELYDFFMRAPVPMAVVSGPTLEITLANAPYIELFGRDVMGQTLNDAFPEPNQQSFISLVERVFKTGEPFAGKEMRFSKRDMHHEVKEYFLNVSFTAFRCHGGNIKGVCLFEQDMTDQVLARKRLEVEKESDQRNQITLQNAKVEAERASHSKSAFLANMSHEIRTPLGAILGFTELMRDSSSREERADFAKIVSRNGKALTRLIDDILDLSKVEAGRLEIEAIDFNVRSLVDEVVALFHDSARQKGVLLHASIAAGTPEAVNSDPTRIRQILLNLIGNALKFTSEGSVEVSVQLQPAGDLQLLEFEVHDTGIGMSSEQAKKLFKPFAQADNTTTRKFGGSGLGLVLSRRLSRLLGGDVTIRECSPGQGCTFKASVLARPAGATEIGVANKTIQSLVQNRELLPGAKILLVEDSPDNQVLVKRLLTNAGMVVDIASNGAEGIEMAEANNYDVVLMDMQMPVLDGYAATARLRLDGYNKPIVALTAHAMVEDRNRILGLGCDAHLTKPIDSKLLIETIGRFQILH